MAPAGYEKMRDEFKKEGMSDKKAKAKAAAIWNAKHKDNPLTRDNEDTQEGMVLDGERGKILEED